MANITLDDGRTSSEPATPGTLERLVRRLRSLARLHRINRFARTRRGLVRDEQCTDRLLADVGIDAREYRRYDWLGALTSAMGGPMR